MNETATPLSNRNKPQRSRRAPTTLAEPPAVVSTPTEPWYERNILWGFVSLIVAVIGARIPDVRWLLYFAWPIGVGAIWFSVSTIRSTRLRASITVVGAAVLAGALYSLSGALKPISHDLTPDQKAEFTKVLRTAIIAPAYVEIVCPAAREDVCLYADSFIPLFQRAGWKVAGPEVQRVTLGRPYSGVTVVHFGPAVLDPQNPDQGVWTKLTPWDQILKTAFEMVGITPASTNDPQLQTDRMRVYFGSIPP